ncbi:hypothetical protein, partial [Methylomonas albis]
VLSVLSRIAFGRGVRRRSCRRQQLHVSGIYRGDGARLHGCPNVNGFVRYSDSGRPPAGFYDRVRSAGHLLSNCLGVSVGHRLVRKKAGRI